jgi:hypothetical protein
MPSPQPSRDGSPQISPHCWSFRCRRNGDGDERVVRAAVRKRDREPSVNRSTTFRATVALSLLAASLGATGAGVPKPTRSDKACSLITTAELAAVVGMKLDKALVGLEVPFKKDATHDHDGSLFTCQGMVGGRYVMVAYGTRPVTPEGRKRAEARVERSQEKLRKEGYAIDARDFGNVKCWTMAAPPADTSATAMFGTNCGGTKGDYFFAVLVSGARKSDIIPVEKLKALVDKAASRLP